MVIRFTLEDDSFRSTGFNGRLLVTESLAGEVLFTTLDDLVFERAALTEAGAGRSRKFRKLRNL